MRAVARSRPVMCTAAPPPRPASRSFRCASMPSSKSLTSRQIALPRYALDEVRSPGLMPCARSILSIIGHSLTPSSMLPSFSKTY